MAQEKILIVCGEASGELHAAGLVKALKEKKPELEILGIGSSLLRSAGAQVLFDIKGLAVMGLFDVLKKLPRFLALKKLILQKIDREKINAVILVDFSGFNLRLSKALNNKIKTIYYVSPQVWASRAGRIKTIKKYISKMIVLFSFEKEFYNKLGLDADFTGHPLLDTAKPQMKKEEFSRKFGLSPKKKTIALLPGSRYTEVNNILPVMLGAASLIQKKLKDVQFVIAKSPAVDWQIYNAKTRSLDLELEIVERQTCDCLNVSDFALVASGTATLETAIMGVPFAVIYKMGLLNYLLYRPQVKTPYIGMVNIVAGKLVVPEFIQNNASAREIADFALGTLNDPRRIAAIQEELSSVKKSLGEPGASFRAAGIILSHLGL